MDYERVVLEIKCSIFNNVTSELCINSVLIKILIYFFKFLRVVQITPHYLFTKLLLNTIFDKLQINIKYRYNTHPFFQ